MSDDFMPSYPKDEAHRRKEYIHRQEQPYPTDQKQEMMEEIDSAAQEDQEHENGQPYVHNSFVGINTHLHDLCRSYEDTLQSLEEEYENTSTENRKFLCRDFLFKSRVRRAADLLGNIIDLFDQDQEYLQQEYNFFYYRLGQYDIFPRFCLEKIKQLKKGILDDLCRYKGFREDDPDDSKKRYPANLSKTDLFVGPIGDLDSLLSKLGESYDELHHMWPKLEDQKKFIISMSFTLTFPTLAAPVRTDLRNHESLSCIAYLPNDSYLAHATQGLIEVRSRYIEAISTFLASSHSQNSKMGPMTKMREVHNSSIDYIQFAERVLFDRLRKWQTEKGNAFRVEGGLFVSSSKLKKTRKVSVDDFWSGTCQLNQEGSWLKAEEETTFPRIDEQSLKLLHDKFAYLPEKNNKAQLIDLFRRHLVHLQQYFIMFMKMVETVDRQVHFTKQAFRLRFMERNDKEKTYIVWMRLEEGKRLENEKKERQESEAYESTKKARQEWLKRREKEVQTEALIDRQVQEVQNVAIIGSDEIGGVEKHGQDEKGVIESTAAETEVAGSKMDSNRFGILYTRESEGERVEVGQALTHRSETSRLEQERRINDVLERENFKKLREESDASEKEKWVEEWLESQGKSISSKSRQFVNVNTQTSNVDHISVYSNVEDVDRGQEEIVNEVDDIDNNVKRDYSAKRQRGESATLENKELQSTESYITTDENLKDTFDYSAAAADDDDFPEPQFASTSELEKTTDHEVREKFINGIITIPVIAQDVDPSPAKFVNGTSNHRESITSATISLSEQSALLEENRLTQTENAKYQDSITSATISLSEQSALLEENRLTEADIALRNGFCQSLEIPRRKMKRKVSNIPEQHKSSNKSQKRSNR